MFIHDNHHLLKMLLFITNFLFQFSSKLFHFVCCLQFHFSGEYNQFMNSYCTIFLCVILYQLQFPFVLPILSHSWFLLSLWLFKHLFSKQVHFLSNVCCIRKLLTIFFDAFFCCWLYYTVEILWAQRALLEKNGGI